MWGREAVRPRRDWAATGARAALVVFVAIVTLPVAAAAVALTLAGRNLRFDLTGAERDHLAPVPIDAAACPSVRAIHRAAVAFDRADPWYLAFSNGAAFEQARTDLARATDVLSFTIVASRERFPAPVQEQFDAVVENLRAGRRALVHATDAGDVLVQTASLERDGRTAFGYADDLVGDRCGARLAVTDADQMP